MPPLHDFVGSREAGIQLFETSEHHPGPSERKTERIQAILQNLASSNNLQPIRLGGTSQDETQQRVIQAPFRNRQSSSRTLHMNIRWQDDRSRFVSKETTNNLRALESEESLQGSNNHPDMFGTDIENFDNTATTRDFGDGRFETDETNTDRDALIGFDGNYVSGPNQGTTLDPENDHDQKNTMDLKLRNTNEYMQSELAIGSEGSDYQRKNGEIQPNYFLVRGIVPKPSPVELRNIQENQKFSEVSTGDFLEGSPSLALTPRIQEILSLRSSESMSKSTIYPHLGMLQSVTYCVTEPMGCKDGSQQSQFNRETPEISCSRNGYEFLRSNETSSATWIHKKNDKQIRNQQPSQTPLDPFQRPALSIHQPRVVSRGSKDDQMIQPKFSSQNPEHSSVVSTALTTSHKADGESVYKATTDPHNTRAVCWNISKRTVNLDYNYAQLYQMAYQDLSHENFDHAPLAGTLNSAQCLTNSELSERLQHLFEMNSDTDLPRQREAAFSSLSIEQHEKCGELMVERFNNVIARYSAARLQKRNVARAFEDEVATRENSIQAKMKAIDDDMNRLRNAGEDVVRGKRSRI